MFPGDRKESAPSCRCQGLGLGSEGKMTYPLARGYSWAQEPESQFRQTVPVASMVHKWCGDRRCHGGGA